MQSAHSICRERARFCRCTCATNALQVVPGIESFVELADLARFCQNYNVRSGDYARHHEEWENAMKAMVFQKPHTPLAPQNRAPPKPRAAEVLIRLRASVLSHRHLIMQQGAF